VALASALAAALIVSRPGAQDVVRTADINRRGLTKADFPRVTRIADRVYTFEQIDPTKRIVTVNNLIVITGDGVLIADGQGTVENTKLLVAAVAKLTPQPIKYIVICSEHGDHTGGNSAFPSGAKFFASPASGANLARQANAADRTQNPATVVVPAETVSSARDLSIGGTDVRILMLGRSHTGGDLEVYLPREKILWMSEVFSNRIFPSMANSYPHEWLQALKNAEQMDVAVYLPAHGFIDSPAILKEEERSFRQALERVVAEGQRLHDAKVPVDQAESRADFGSFSDWTRRADNAAGGLRRVYMEIDGELR
jgi:glyoxylase-like metal-dependent hydrolase (beta-lactamase superfamily II)